MHYASPFFMNDFFKGFDEVLLLDKEGEEVKLENVKQ